MLTFFYVDAFNLYFGSCRGTPYKWLDLAKLMEIVFPRNQVGTFAHRHWRRANSPHVAGRPGHVLEASVLVTDP